MSVPAWYFDWAKAHCAAFGFAAQQAETVAAWGPVFVHLFAPDDLADATRHLTGREDVPKWAADHRGLIIATVRHLRQRAAAPAQAESYAAGACIECRGAGVVIVPHPGLVEFGKWRAELLPPFADPDGERSKNRTAAVCCVLCPKGERMRQASEQGERTPLLTISGYERLYRNWREVEKARKALREASAQPPTAAQVERLNQELEAIRKGAGQREAGRPTAA